MLEVAAVVAFLALTAILVGAPLALASRSSEEGWAALLIDAALYGTALTSLGIVMWGWLGAAGIVIDVAFLGLTIYLVFARRATFPTWRLLNVRQAAIAGTWASLLVIAAVLRFRDVNFVMWTGDMGAYVNWANEFVRGGELLAEWPPLFTAFLSIATAVFGQDSTTAGVAVTGLLFIGALVRVLQRLSVPFGVVLAVGAIVVFHVHAVWYSSFPSSESLNAPLFLAWVSIVIGFVRSRGQQRWVFAILAFAILLALGMLRGTGPALIIPVVALLIASICTPEWRSAIRPLAALSLLGIAATVIVYWYGISEIRPYFVEMQIESLAPPSITAVATALGLFDATVGTGILLAVLFAGSVFGVVVLFFRGGRDASPIARGFSGEAASRGIRFVPIITATLIAFAMGAALLLRAEIFAILYRVGPWLALLAVATLVLARLVRLSAEQILFTVFLELTAGMFIVLHLIRLRSARAHDFFIYWDRYVYSEIFPAFLVIAAVGAAAAWAVLLARRPVRRPVIFGVLAVALVVIPSTPTLALSVEKTYVDGNRDFQNRIGELVPPSAGPVFWSSTTGDRLDDFYFPNTWMAFGVPLSRSQGFEVLNVVQEIDDFAPDDVASASVLADALSCVGGDSIVVIETDAGGEKLPARLAADVAAGSIVIDELGSAESDIDLLAQPPVDGWTTARVRVDAWLVHFAEGSNSVASDCSTGQ